MNSHTASLEITVNVHESVLSRKLVFWTSNWKHVIKYDLYVEFSRIFAHNVHVCAKFRCKNFNDVCQVFRILHQTYLGGGVFSWTRCSVPGQEMAKHHAKFGWPPLSDVGAITKPRHESRWNLLGCRKLANRSHPLVVHRWRIFAMSIFSEPHAAHFRPAF